MKTFVSVISGDIANTQTDALITAINSGGMWFGGIDGVIKRVAGNLFHSQAMQSMPLSDGQTVIARGNSISNGAAFGNVVFVVDDLRKPLSEIIYSGLKAASDAGFKSVTLPTIRMGVMLGVVEKSVDEALAEMSIGVQNFLNENSGALKSITFVVYGDRNIQSMLRKSLE